MELALTYSMAITLMTVAFWGVLLVAVLVMLRRLWMWLLGITEILRALESMHADQRAMVDELRALRADLKPVTPVSPRMPAPVDGNERARAMRFTD